MDLAFAAESLKPVAKDHILARKATDLEAVRHLAAHHIELVKIVLNSFGGKATADQIQQVLVPDVITDDWKKWWEVARREMKKDGHFIVPTKKDGARGLPGQGNVAAGPAAPGFSRGQGPQGARGDRGGNPQGHVRPERPGGGGRRK